MRNRISYFVYKKYIFHKMCNGTSFILQKSTAFTKCATEKVHKNNKICTQQKNVKIM